MQLSAESFNDLRSAMDLHRGPASGHSRKIPIAPVLLRKSPTLSALLGQFTPQGMQLTLPESLQTGEKIVAEFPSRSQPVVNLLCTIGTVERLPDGQWSYTCEFICTISASHASDAAEIHRISASMLDW